MRDSAPDLEWKWSGAWYVKENGKGVEGRNGEEKEVKNSELYGGRIVSLGTLLELPLI